MKLLVASVALGLSLLTEQCNGEVGAACVVTLDCNNGLEFCGSDQTCRHFSCDDYYTYGLTTFTGNDGSAQLSCEAFAGPDTSSVGVDFRCSPDDPPVVREDFNRKCTATTNGLSAILEFTCLEYADDTDFTGFVDSSLALNETTPCDQGNLYYAYRTALSNSTFRATTGVQNFNFNGNLPLRTIETNLTATSSPSPTTTPGPGECNDSDDCANAFEFCGTDRECHPYSCSEFYEFGRTDFTGNDGTAQLSCTELSGTVQEVTGASYRCSNLTDPTPVRAPFDTNCTAETSLTQFECWEYSEDYDFTDFINEAGLSSLVCQNASDTPRYYYNLAAQQGEVGPVIVAFGFSSAFDEELAGQSLQSIVTTKTTGTGAPTTDDSAAPSAAAVPSTAPSSSMAPSSSVAPTMSPTTSVAPTSSLAPSIGDSEAPSVTDVSSSPSSSLSPTSSLSPSAAVSESPSSMSSPPPTGSPPLVTASPTTAAPSASLSPSASPSVSGAMAMLPASIVNRLVASCAIVAMVVSFVL